MSSDTDRVFALYARYGLSGANELLRRLGVTAPAGDAGKGDKEELVETWQKVADAAEGMAKFAGVKGALLAGDGKADAQMTETKGAVIPFATQMTETKGAVSPCATQRIPQTVDELLATPMTPAERDTLLACVRLTIDPRIPSTTRETILTAFANLMRAWRFITFDREMPLLDMANLYDWYCAYGADVHVRFESRGSYATTVVNLPYTLAVFAEPDRWPSDRFENIVSLGRLLLHEAWHVVGDGGRSIAHNCAGQLDTDIAYGGAYAVAYWYDRFLAEHSGEYLTARQKTQAVSDVTITATVRFCTPQSITMAPPPVPLGPHAPRPMTMSVTTPRGADVTLGGRSADSTNTTDDPSVVIHRFRGIQRGDHTLVVRVFGYEPWIYRIPMTGSDQNITPTLVRGAWAGRG